MARHSVLAHAIAWRDPSSILFAGETVQCISIRRFERIWQWDGERINAYFGTTLSPSRDLVVVGGRRGATVLNAQTGEVVAALSGGNLYASGWHPASRLLAVAGNERVVQLATLDGSGVSTLEGHRDLVCSATFSHDGRILASCSRDGTVRLWNTSTGASCGILKEPAGRSFPTRIDFNPCEPLLATIDESHCVVHLWEIDVDLLLRGKSARASEYYSNAKVVLVGDTGVGKSGLGLVLAGKKWTKTESTHGRRVRPFESKRDNCEILLWDLAGQPDYRIIHQLHLSEVSVALILFDSRSQTDPFAGVRHWIRALRLAQHTQGSEEPALTCVLVAARSDVGRVGVPKERIEALKSEFGVDHFIETSAKEGTGISKLAAIIRRSIAWPTLPRVSSTKLFRRIKAFLVREKLAGRLLSTVDDLFRAFEKTASKPPEDFRAQFETCVGLVQSRGLIQRLTFGNLVLLQPELRDAYASALVNAAKGEPDGWGSIREEVALSGVFMPAGQRIPDKHQERLLLIATVEDLLRHEIALRESGDDGPFLVFPSQLTRENPGIPDAKGRSVIFTFDGPVLNIYATLAVRLSHCGLFRTKERWKNAACFFAKHGGNCGIVLREIEDGRGEFTLFFEGATEVTRKQFEDYVQTHLERRALRDSIDRRAIVRCPKCNVEITQEMIDLKMQRGQ